MSEYANKLALLAAKKQKLQEEEIHLIEKRKKEIGNLAERCGLLMASDELIAGLFAHAEKSLSSKDNCIKEWETEGARFLKPRKNSTEAKATSHATA